MYRLILKGYPISINGLNGFISSKVIRFGINVRRAVKLNNDITTGNILAITIGRTTTNCLNIINRNPSIFIYNLVVNLFHWNRGNTGNRYRLLVADEPFDFISYLVQLKQLIKCK